MSDPWGQPQQPSGDWPASQGDQQQPGGPPYQQGGGQFGPPMPAYGYPAAPMQQGSNGIAIAGFILAFFCTPAGLILSIIGLVKSKERGGKGKGLSIAGIIISVVVFIAGIAIFALAAHTVKSATALDPGCTSLDTKLSAETTALSADTASTSATIADLNTMHNSLLSAEGVATHDTVKVKLQALDVDVQNYLSDVKAVAAGTSTDNTKLSTDVDQLNMDTNAVDTICSTM